MNELMNKEIMAEEKDLQFLEEVETEKLGEDQELEFSEEVETEEVGDEQDLETSEEVETEKLGEDQELELEFSEEAETEGLGDEQDLETSKAEVEKAQQQTSIDEEELLEEFMFGQLIPVKTKFVSKLIGEPGVLTIINSKSNGKRIAIASSVMEMLNNPLELQVAFWSNGLIVGRELPHTEQNFPVKKSGKKGVIYSGGLVQEVSVQFNLDFSSRVSITFQNVTYKKVNGQTIALFNLVK